MSWGSVPVASKLGIKYCFALNNGSDRVGLSTELSFKPFWWLGQDGKSKILFLQPGSYNPGALAKGFAYWPLMAGQTDPSKLIQIVKTDHPRDNFIDSYLDQSCLNSNNQSSIHIIYLPCRGQWPTIHQLMLIFPMQLKVGMKNMLSLI